jgi:hypothetical protein
LDCYAYGSAEEGLGAAMRLEFRLVYDKRMTRLLEGYFIVPIPSGHEEVGFRDEVMNAIANAAREISGGEVSTKDRGVSVAAGFDYALNGSTVQVRPIKETSYVRGRQALQVQILPRERVDGRKTR